jgi:nucleotide-binding universal stress UspA family protein
MSVTTALLTLGATWLGVGLLLALVMGRRGHDPFPWWLIGSVLGPLALPLALSAERRRLGAASRTVRAGVPGHGPVDVLAGIDGSPEAAAALATALDLLGPRVGRLTLASVTRLDGSVEHEREERQALAELERQAELVRARLVATPSAPPGRPRLPQIVLLSGRPSEALERLATEGGFDLLVVGTRGSGLSKFLLGSTARALAVHAKVPVLLAGGAAATPAGGRRPGGRARLPGESR